MAAKVLQNRPDVAALEVFQQMQKSEADAAKILKQHVKWDVYVESKILDREQLGLLEQYIDESEEDRNSLLDEMGDDYARLFVYAIENIAAPEPVRYLLALIEHLLSVNKQRARMFLNVRTPDVNPYRPFVRILRLTSKNVDPFMIHTSSRILSVLLSVEGITAEDEALQDYVEWLIKNLEGPTGDGLHLVSALKTLLRSQSAQEVFVEQGGLKSLASLLRKETQNTQLLYVVVFCFWLLSYNTAMHKHLRDCDTIGKLTGVLKSAPRKKVVRIAFAMLQNLLENQDFKDRMIASGLMKLLPGLQTRKWGDGDLEKDIEVVNGSLQSYVITLSSFDKYHAEVSSGSLQWSPVHSEKFFRENINRFGDDNFQLARDLIALLDAEDPLTLEVVCYDIGEFARFHPDGRRVIGKLGGKQKLMTRMSHKDPKVAKQALLTVQKLMVQNWESLASGKIGSSAQ